MNPESGVDSRKRSHSVQRFGVGVEPATAAGNAGEQSGAAKIGEALDPEESISVWRVEPGQCRRIRVRAQTSLRHET